MATSFEERAKKVDIFEALPKEEKLEYFHKAIDILSGLYTCTRTWSAWDYETMTKDDFWEAQDVDDIVFETAVTLHDFRMSKYRKYKIDTLLESEKN